MATGVVAFGQTVATMDVDWAIPMGVPVGGATITTGRAQGYVNLSGSLANTAVRATTYTPQGGALSCSFVSTSANDNASGSGGQTITINYLDSSFVMHSESVTLNGTTPVNTVGGNYAYIENIQVTTVGSGQVNAGIIKIFTQPAGAGSVWGSIAAGDQNTFWAHHYVPTGVTCYITNFSAGGTVVTGDTNLVHQQSLATPGAPTVQLGTAIVHPVGQWDHDFQVPVALPGPDLVWVNEQATVGTPSKTVAGFEYIQF
jgi:hypothetical protein